MAGLVADVVPEAMDAAALAITMFAVLAPSVDASLVEAQDLLRREAVAHGIEVHGALVVVPSRSDEAQLLPVHPVPEERCADQGHLALAAKKTDEQTLHLVEVERRVVVLEVVDEEPDEAGGGMMPRRTRRPWAGDLYEPVAMK